MPLRSFAETYNFTRHDGQDKITVPVPPKVSSWAWEAMSNPIALGVSRRGRELHARDSYAYRLIRSDVDEEGAAHDRPNLPSHQAGMKARSKHVAGYTATHAVHADKNPLAWVDSQKFQGISGIVICINAILIGLETDVETWVWFYIEQLLLCFFTFELLLRMARHGLNFFKHEEDRMWNVFDFFIVASGVFDQWVVPIVSRLLASSGSSHGGGAKMSVYFLLMRMLRLLRVVRLFRLVRIVRPLYELAQGVLEALQGMFWVLVFLVMSLYGVAILCTRLIGNGYILPEGYEEDRHLSEIVSMFTSVEDSMFTLFGALTSWSLLKFVPLFESMPVLKPMFVVFYVYSAWALLAVMTGVVSENMIAIREQMVKEDEARDEVRRSMVAQTLVELFQVADTDKSGFMSRQEFDALIGSPEVIRKVERNTHLKIQDLQDLFEWLDKDDTGVSHDEFMKGFTRLNEPLRAKTLVKLQERWGQDLRRLQTRVTQALEKRLLEVETLVAAPLRKVHAITEQMQTLDVQLSGMRGADIAPDQGMPSRQEVRDVEQRLGAKLAVITRRLQQIERASMLTQ